MLSTSQLDLRSEVTEWAVDFFILVRCGHVSLSLAFSNNTFYESFVLDDVGDDGTCFFMAIDEGNSHINCLGEVAKQETSEERAYKWFR